MFETLRQYSSVAWDFDETLIDHDYSPMMWDFIHANPYGQTHHLVTFRSGGLQLRMDFDLEIRESRLRLSDFTTVNCCPHALWVQHEMRRRAGQAGLKTSENRDPYIYWKGKVCADKSIPVIVDDATANVKPGCDKYGVRLIHPDVLLTATQA